MSALGSRVARSVVALRPLPAVQRGLRTSSAVRQADPNPYEAKEPKPRGDQWDWTSLIEQDIQLT